MCSPGKPRNPDSCPTLARLQAGLLVLENGNGGGLPSPATHSVSPVSLKIVGSAHDQHHERNHSTCLGQNLTGKCN